MMAVKVDLQAQNTALGGLTPLRADFYRQVAVFRSFAIDQVSQQ